MDACTTVWFCGQLLNMGHGRANNGWNGEIRCCATKRKMKLITIISVLSTRPLSLRRLALSQNFGSKRKGVETLTARSSQTRVVLTLISVMGLQGVLLAKNLISAGIDPKYVSYHRSDAGGVHPTTADKTRTGSES